MSDFDRGTWDSTLKDKAKTLPDNVQDPYLDAGRAWGDHIEQEGGMVGGPQSSLDSFLDDQQPLSQEDWEADMVRD